MTHRIKNSSSSVNLEPLACEKYMARMLKKEMKTTSKSNSSSQNHKFQDHSSKQSYNNSQVNKNKTNAQESLPLKNRKSCGNLLDYSDDTHLYQPGISTTARHKSRPSADHELWGQLLKSERSTDRSSIFGSFDPLRTLHFLVKELQFQLKTILPDDNTILQIVIDMHQALKRVPPEVASTIHLQQAIDLLPVKKKSKTSLEIPEKLKSTSEQGIQTSLQVEENEKLQKIMMENSLKLESSCRQMETLCMNLKTEKEDLEKQLKFEKENVIYYKKRIEDLENNNSLLATKVRNLENEKEELKLELERLKISCETQYLTSTNNLKSQISDLKNSKTLFDQECTKLKHQLKLSILEKEKYSAVLAIRDQQISVMKNEMLQLHEVISCRFLDLQKNAVQSLPKLELMLKEFPDGMKHNKENNEDCTISTIYSDQHQMERLIATKQDKEYQELTFGENDISDNF